MIFKKYTFFDKQGHELFGQDFLLVRVGVEIVAYDLVDASYLMNGFFGQLGHSNGLWGIEWM